MIDLLLNDYLYINIYINKVERRRLGPISSSPPVTPQGKSCQKPAYPACTARRPPCLTVVWIQTADFSKRIPTRVARISATFCRYKKRASRFWLFCG